LDPPGSGGSEIDVEKVEDAGQLSCDVQVVGDQQERCFDFGAELADEIEDLLGVGGIERASGLVGEDEPGTVGQGTGDGDALLLADGELGGPVVEAVGEADFGEEMLGPAAIGWAAGEGHAEEDIFQGGEAGEEMMGLEDVADVSAAEFIALGFGEGGEIDFDFCGFGGVVSEDDRPAVGGEDAGDHVEESGFAGAAGSDESDLFAVGEEEFGDVDDGDGAAVGAEIYFFESREK
jgi:hypothetical protein